MQIDVGWIPLIWGLSFALGIIFGYQLFRRASREVDAIVHEKAALGEAFGLEQTSNSIEAELAKRKAQRRAMLKEYALNVVPFVRRPNRAWRKWSKPEKNRIYSRSRRFCSRLI
jgi:hypothetical protein